LPFVYAKPTPSKTIVLFFDDGWQNQYDVALPLLKHFRFYATFGIITDLIGSDQNTLWARMTSSQIQDLSKKGFEIASHSVTHPYLTTMTYEQVMFELTESKRALESLNVRTVKNFIVPFCDDNPQVDSEILEVYSSFRNYQNVLFVGSEDFKTFTKEISEMGNVFFLCYHQIRKASGDFITSPNLFYQEMSWIYLQRYHVISFEQYLRN
jgi:peptidoglycan/xylan/chitin deacetylase (PgdA/CDA1 family)